MSKKLLITEKPSVAMEFAKALNINTARKNGFLESSEWIVTWCVGHLVTMSYPEKYDEKLKFWSLNSLPFLPKEYKYEVIDSVSKQYEIVKSLLLRDDVDMIYVCTDSGREGEYIYRLVDKMANVGIKIKKRVWIDSQTEEEIIKGINNAKDLSEYDNLSSAAYLRAKEDYLIGINFSRVLSLRFGKKLTLVNKEEKALISAGRVMTCVLGMIVSREREIKNFRKTKFYKIIGTFGSDVDNGFEADWKVNEKSKYFESNLLYNEYGFKDIASTDKLIEELKSSDAKPTITEVNKKKQKENAPLLFNLAELQNECTKNFKIKPDETLEVTQILYEKKLITYPRTDARVLSTAVSKEISKNLNGIFRGYNDTEVKDIINKMVQEKYSTNLNKTKYVNDSKITDHYAIIPTGQGYENFEKLTLLQKKIYKLIVKRFVAIFYPPAEFSKVNITINVNKETFYASGRVCLNEGYLYVFRNNFKNITEIDSSIVIQEDIVDRKEQNMELLKNFKKGQTIESLQYVTKDCETSPPTRYNSGSIILAMENAGKLIEDEELREQIKGSGIGTSATRAEIIKKLERIKYIFINDKTQIITPTEKGEIIYNIIYNSIQDMLNPELTASWEKGLDMVAKGEITEEVFMRKLEDYITKRVNFLKMTYS